MSDVGSVREWVGVAESAEKGEDNCIPHFFFRPIQNKKKTEEEGRPIFDEIPYIEIIIPGDKSARHITKVKDEHQRRFPVAWAEFVRTNEETYGGGMPVEDWPYLTRGQVMEMRALGLHTVESIANLSDAGLQKIGTGARELQERARQHLQPQTETETELRKRLSELEAQVRELEADNSRLVQDEDDPVPRRRGRPPGSKNKPKTS